MAVIGTPIQTVVTGTVVCTDLALVEPETPTHEGCPINTRQGMVTVNKGVMATVRWEMKDRAGNAVDLSSCLGSETIPLEGSLSLSEISEEGGSIMVRFASCDESGPIYEVDGEVDTPTMGLVRFQLPEEVYNVAGIWRVQIAILDGNGNPVFMNSGLISVERGLFGTSTQRTGPPTINEIRIHMRDSQVENDLLMDVEFDDEEIIHAIIRPVQYWNETPPLLRSFVYNCATFPWKYHWLNGTVAQLMRTAGMHYLRNKLQVSHAGVQVNDRDKDSPYIALSTMYWEEFQEFVTRKKVEINARQMFGSVGSEYA